MRVHRITALQVELKREMATNVNNTKFKIIFNPSFKLQVVQMVKVQGLRFVHLRSKVWPDYAQAWDRARVKGGL